MMAAEGSCAKLTVCMRFGFPEGLTVMVTAKTDALSVSQAFKKGFEVRRQVFELRAFGGDRIPGGF
jgi:hypothetical protein